MMWRIFKIIIGCYLIANLIGAYFFWHRIDQFLRFMPRVAEASFKPPMNDLEAQQQDLIYLNTVLNYDRSFSSAAREDFNARIETLKLRDSEMSNAEFYMEVRVLMALANNGHTNVGQSPAFRDFNRSGIDVYPFADGLFVVRAHKFHADMIGKEILSIEGLPIAEVIKELREYSGGPNQWRDLQSLNLLRSPDLMNAVGLANSSTSLTVTFKGSDGDISERVLSALPSASDAGYVYRHSFSSLAPISLGDEDGNWVQTLDESTHKIPYYLANIFEPYTARDLDGGLYIQSNYLMSSPGISIKSKLLSALTSVPDGGYDYIVLDLRWNPGGDYGNAVAFAERVSSALSEDGKIYVLVGPNTFSAAIVFSALLKQHAPNKTLLIGEPMGDRPQFWAERGKPFRLPNSNYWINYSTAFHDWENGCAGTHKYCFPPNKKYDANIGKLAIDKFIQPSFADYESGKDVLMDWVITTQNAVK